MTPTKPGQVVVLKTSRAEPKMTTESECDGTGYIQVCWFTKNDHGEWSLFRAGMLAEILEVVE